MDVFAATLWIGALVAGGIGLLRLAPEAARRSWRRSDPRVAIEATVWFVAAIALAVAADATLAIDGSGVFAAGQ